MSKTSPTMGKPMPSLHSDEEVEQFIATANLAEFNLSGFKPMPLEALMKEVQVNVRLPQKLYRAVKQAAVQQGVPHSRFVRRALEDAVGAQG